MSDTVLLLGHPRQTGLELVRELVALGCRAFASDWKDFILKSWKRDRPDVILANIDSETAPPLDEFCDTVRKSWGKHYPIIAMTAEQKVMHIADVLEKGVNDCLPHRPPTRLLDRKITRCIRRNTAPAATLRSVRRSALCVCSDTLRV